jgi:hypothetical protein
MPTAKISLRSETTTTATTTTCHFEDNLARINHILARVGGHKFFVSKGGKSQGSGALKHIVAASPV